MDRATKGWYNIKSIEFNIIRKSSEYRVSLTMRQQLVMQMLCLQKQDEIKLPLT